MPCCRSYCDANCKVAQAENHIVPFLPSLIQEPNHSNQNPPAVEYVPGHHRKSEDDVSDDGSTSSSDADFPDHFYRTARFRTKDDVEIELLILFDTGSSKNFAFPKAVTLLGLDCQPIPRNHIHWYTSPIKDGCEVKPEYFVEAMFTVPGLIHEEQEVKLKIIEDATDELDIIIGKPFMAAYREKYGVSLLGQLEDTQPEIRNPRHGRAVLVLKKGARRKGIFDLLTYETGFMLTRYQMQIGSPKWQRRTPETELKMTHCYPSSLPTIMRLQPIKPPLVPTPHLPQILKTRPSI